MEEYKIITLDNGIRAIFAKRDNFHRTSVRVRVYAGSVHEEKPGAAHFFEHILFQGSEEFPSEKQLDDYCDQNAIFINARTTKFDTVYMVDGLEAESSIKVAAQLVFHPLINEESVENERNAILEETKSYQFAPGSEAFRTQRSVTGGEAYGSLITGTVLDVEAITYRDLLDFHQAQYRPENMLVVI